MSILRLFTALFLALGITSISSNVKAGAHCSNVTIAEMNWASAQVIAHIDAVLLRGLGCEVELIPGDTMPTATSLVEKGEPSIAPELWSQNIKPILDPAEAEGLIKNVGKVFENGGEEAIWIPTYIAQEHGIVTIDDALARPDLFPHPEDSSVAGFYGCPAGWNCQITTTQMFKAFGMADAGFEFIDPGSGGALSGAMGEAYNKGEGWMGYYWGPTAILGKYDMTKLEEGVEHNRETWLSEINDLNVEAPGRNKYPASVVETYVGKDMLDNSEVMGYLEKRSFPNSLLSQILAWKEENQAEAEETAYYFLENFSNVWGEWVPFDQKLEIQNSL